MLVELLVENYAVVERVRIRFHAGLNALTGETGSGKSIVVDALGLLFGGRASAEMVRSGVDRARISGIFALPPEPEFHAALEELGLEQDDGELLVEREILSSGKSRAFVGSRPVAASVLRDLAPWLGDIHGQHDQQRLFSPEAQRELLDDFARAHALREDVAGRYRAWRAVKDELAELDRNEQDKLRLLDLWNFQRKEIETVQPVAGEDTALEQERQVLQNVAKLGDSADAAFTALYDAPESAHAQLRTSAKRLEELVRIDASLQEVLELVRQAEVSVQEASYTLRDYVGSLEADPDRLDAVETRLAALDKLKRKYGGSLAEVQIFLAQVTEQAEAVENAGERRVALQQQEQQFAKQYHEAASRLSKQRQKAGDAFSVRVVEELQSLAMQRSQFAVGITATAPSPQGTDAVQFMFSANLGEQLKPLDKVASGGELSRVALAIKAVTTSGKQSKQAPATTLRTLVFDEVDAGIGGTAANSVGQRLKRIASENQVLCVTHLAQIAGYADHHYVVEKSVSKGRTMAHIEELRGERRTLEISRMLSGQVTPEALRHAEQLIRTGEER